MMLLAGPAKEWKEGLPIGNGMLAAMVLGGVESDRLALNHEWLWRGKGRDRDISPRHQYLQGIRDYFFQGKVLEGSTLANAKLGGLGGLSHEPGRVDPYQPAGDLWIETQHKAEEYSRTLDLDQAVVTVSYKSDGATFTRQSIAHSTLPVIAVHLCSDNAKPFKATISLGRIEDPECELTTSATAETLSLAGRFPEGIRFAIEAKVVTDGTARPEGDKLVVEAGEILVLLSIAVDINDGDLRENREKCLAQIKSAPANWQQLLDSHVAAHQEMYRRVRFEIGEDHDHEIPLENRLAAVRDGESDEGLLTLYANLGRYLLISSSRPGGLPANLQGKWNEELAPPWESDLHNDINIEMNYWPAEVCGLAECTGPLLDYMEQCIPHGRKMAKALYNCRGVYMPIQTDIWARPTVESRGWDVWTGAAAWLAQHMWWRYEYSGDVEFLRARAYPYFCEVANFYEDYLVTDPRNGYLVPVPSQSPENTFVGGTWPTSLCVAATMDLELIHDVLSHAIRATEILGCDADAAQRWKDILAKLPPLQIGKHGQLQEWFEDYEEAEPQHRHISHLFALFPGEQITLEDEPELTKAVRVSLERRLACGGAHTGWSRAWTICCWAHLQDGDQAREHLQSLVANQSTVSLLDLHPPAIFQIEGNFGATAGVCEMLMQSHRGTIRLLPALPTAWPNGKVAGLHARGGFVVDIDWAASKPTSVKIVSKLGGPCRVSQTNVADAKITCNGEPVEVKTSGEGLVEFQTTAGKNYKLEW